jgi:hypothetical protein
VIAKNEVDLFSENGGRDRDRTCDPYHVKVVSWTCERLVEVARA